MTNKLFKKITHMSVAGFMAIWLSGLLFLLCCYVQSAKAAEMDSCPLVKLGANCDKAEKEIAAEKITRQTNDPGVECCAFIPAFFDKSRTIDANQHFAAAAPTNTIVRPRIVKVQTNFAPAFSHHSIVLRKNNSFLKNRTFRI